MSSLGLKLQYAQVDDLLGHRVALSSACLRFFSSALILG